MEKFLRILLWFCQNSEPFNAHNNKMKDGATNDVTADRSFFVSWPSGFGCTFERQQPTAELERWSPSFAISISNGLPNSSL
jgi:hypothetical protein